MRVLTGSLSPVVAAGVALLALTAWADEAPTARHEPGRCAIRGHCKEGSFGSGPLPCVDNGEAGDIDDDARKKLVDVCGDKWASGPVCCTAEQIDTLEQNFKTPDGMVGSCPACKSNFHNIFCTFTCSPDQSLFVNVTDFEVDGEKRQVTELDNLWSDEYGKGFYDSCKDVKYTALNVPAMTLIGGGAKNYTEFFDFLGKKQPLGSPFQMNFPRPSDREFPEMSAPDDIAKPCNTSDPDYACVCADCDAACDALPELAEESYCYVGAWPCLTFAVVVIYAIFILALAGVVTGRIAYKKHTQTRHERLRLLQDTSMSDDEDEDGQMVHQAGVLSRPTRKYYLNTLCDTIFSALGRTCAQFPAVTITTNLVLVAFLSLGWLRFAVETDPVKLWVAPDSDAAQEKAFFDMNFGPFFRAEQVFLVSDSASSTSGSVLSYETLEWWSGVEKRVGGLTPVGHEVTFEDVCYKPPGFTCVVQSPLRYWDRDRLEPSTWKEHLEGCVRDPTSCRPKYEQPLDPKMVFGGSSDSILESKALITTWVVRNHEEGSKELERAMDWENSLKQLLQSEVQEEAKSRGLRLSFNTEISLEQELNKSTNTDAKIVVISYIIMFIYASLALGSTTVAAKTVLRHPTVALVQSKFMLGVAGIVIVLFSVSASVGLFSAVGVKVTLIIAEVIPFLVLAVGVDNIFLIVHEFERVNSSSPDDPVEDRMGRALGRMGPSILLSATMETVAFALGAFVGMPAVRNFALYAAGAVLINAILQVTMFVSVLALNQRRVEENRIDCFPCVRVRGQYGIYDGQEDGLQKFIRRVYAPALLGRRAKIVIVTVFLGLLTAGIALLPTVKLGLDQRIALPSDSYLIDYFNDLDEYFDVGPPVYFVTRELNVTQRKHQEQLCSRFSDCSDNSLTNILDAERKRPNTSYIAAAPASWIDDYFLWLNPGSVEECCHEPKTKEVCGTGRIPPFGFSLPTKPEGKEFTHYANIWISQKPEQPCILAGKAAYSEAVVLSESPLTVPASHFRTSHTPLRSQDDFIASYAAARRIASDIESHNPGLSVFPYSKSYIFFDQYATIVKLTLTLIGSAVAACFLISAILLGSIRTALVVSLTVVMTLVDIGGAMAVANVSLNAVTLVNLVICVGISVEFCAHIARAFQFPSARLLERASFPGKIVAAGDGAALRGRDLRAWAALTQVGASVFSGITITKLLGVAVLAFTRSKIFEIYYFRVWLALVVFAAAHALVFLPVALSWFGGDGYIDPVAEGGLEEDLARRRGRPLLADDDEDDDDDDYDTHDL